jgi:prepilin signal peptidase PulO-like enzyme (type II secretory pathway)
MLPVFLFILGLIVGSFLNVVSFRYFPEEKSFLSYKNWFGRSHCQHCHQKLAWFELIPVLSFLIQKGKCWVCHQKLSWQYPIVELASGFTFLLPFYLISNFQFPITNFQLLSSILWILIFLIFLLIWTIDYRLYIIPNELNIALASLGIILISIKDFFNQFGEFQGSFLGSYAALFGLRQNIWLNHFAAALIAAALFGLIIYLSRGRGMGMGDLKLAAVLGLVFGWPDILLALVFSFLIGGIVSLALVVLKKKNMKSRIPFGPFIILGSLALIFFGQQILDCYFNFLNFL